MHQKRECLGLRVWSFSLQNEKCLKCLKTYEKHFHLLRDFFNKIRVVFALSENIVGKVFQIDGEENALVEIKAYNFYAATNNLR